MTKPNVSRNDEPRPTHIRRAAIVMIMSTAVAVLVTACATGQSTYDAPNRPPDRGAGSSGGY